MKSNHPYYPYQQQQQQQKKNDEFWGINVSNIPSKTTENEISNEFKKYGNIFSIKSVSSSSMDIVFQSSKKNNSIENIINDQKKYKVTSLDSKKLLLYMLCTLFFFILFIYLIS